MLKTLSVLCGLIISVILLFVWRGSPVPHDEAIAQPQVQETLKKPLLGETMLAQHGLAGTQPLQDISLLHSFITVANSENPHIDTYYFSTNPDLTEILLGKKGMSHPQLSREHSIVGKNQYGETALLDRWGTAYRIHLISRQQIEVFSAGPDTLMGTADDLRWPPADDSGE